jgi:hypothetical protein
MIYPVTDGKSFVHLVAFVPASWQAGLRGKQAYETSERTLGHHTLVGREPTCVVPAIA